MVLGAGSHSHLKYIQGFRGSVIFNRLFSRLPWMAKSNPQRRAGVEWQRHMCGFQYIGLEVKPITSLIIY
jgi:hypothetical protein